MAILTPDNIRTEKTPSGSGITIKEKIIPSSAKATKDVAPYVPQGAPIKPDALLNDGRGRPKGITIHNTNDITVAVGTTPAEQYTRATWPNCNMGGAVVHFYVYKNDVWQNLSETEQGWHAADSGTRRQSHRPGETIGGNLDTIAIECIGNIPESEDTTAMLAAYLLAKYDLSPDTDLYTHKDFYPGKTCPVYILPYWDSFVAKVKQYYIAPAVPQPQPAKPSGAFKVGDKVVFAGGNVYASSTAPAAAAVKGSAVCQVTVTAPGAPHPYHCIGGGVYGWVDASSLGADSPSPPPKPASDSFLVGDKVRIRSGVKKFADGTDMSSIIYNAKVLYIRQIGSGIRAGQLLTSTVPAGAVTGWVKTPDILKIRTETGSGGMNK